MFDFSKQYLQSACQAEATATNQKVGQQGCSLTDETQHKGRLLEALTHDCKAYCDERTETTEATQITVVSTFAAF